MWLRGNLIDQATASNQSQLIALFNDESSGSYDKSGKAARFEINIINNTSIGTKLANGKTQRLVNMRNDSIDTHVQTKEDHSSENVETENRSIGEKQAQDQTPANSGCQCTTNQDPTGMLLFGIFLVVLGMFRKRVNEKSQLFGTLKTRCGNAKGNIDKTGRSDSQVPSKKTPI